MLLSFSVENYLSIRDRQTLDLRRVGDGTVSRLAIDGEPAGAVATPVAVICGANASGKSNLLDAMDYVQWLVRNSARREAGDPLPTRPFLLDAESKDRPFACSFRFMTAGREFSYAFSLHNGRVTGEELRETTQGTVRRSTRTLFSRQTDGNTANVTTSEALRGPKKAIIAATRPNSLFLSKAAQENFAPLL
ncbi:MAG: AAA family ATPase, partial [Propionibacteriaceae bacterium]|nr:AAA family ATPase [Propionibacteriaceae bacterium]